jgi:hypothetical protein
MLLMMRYIADPHCSRLLAALMLLLMGAACSSQPTATDRSQSVRYESIGRTGYYVFSKGSATHGLSMARNPTSEQQREFQESLGYSLYDCSTSSYRCLRTWFRVFAVPRGQLSSSMKYSVDGVQLRVEACLRASGDVCQVALISADCQLMVGDDACKLHPDGRAKSPQPGPITYFIYNEDYGVTAFGTAGEWPEPAERLDVAQRVASQVVLQGDAGLLKASLATTPASKLK